jgi:geranylgeranylglycerol-phosphate geranylgeranyltransferase
MIGFAVIVGEFVSKPQSIPILNSVLGFLTGFFICGYSMVINDYYDIDVDRVNQPGRPIPSGRISKKDAFYFAQVLLLLGLLSALLIQIVTAFLIAALYAFLSFLYNYSAKKRGILGNSIVASSLAIPFIYGGVVTGGQINSLLLSMALTSFLAGVGREVVKAMADTEGDQNRGVRSIAISSGTRAASIVGGAFFVAAIATSQLPVFFGNVDLIYKLGVLVPDAIFAYLAFSILQKPSAENALRVKSRALIGMLVGLIVFIGGAF